MAWERDFLELLFWLDGVFRNHRSVLPMMAPDTVRKL